MNALKVCSSIFGSTIASATFFAFVVLSGFFARSCPTAIGSGLVCNGHGTCNAGFCVCEPQFSGDTCEDTMCAGYSTITGDPCNARGLCGFGMTWDDVPDECYQTQPSFDTDYTRIGLGWAAPECRARVERSLKVVKTGIFEENDVLGAPMCACVPPWEGDGCERNGCPTTVDFQICGGPLARNASVGYVRNDTRNGLGCQCVNTVNLLSVIDTFSADAVREIQNKHLDYFTRGLCGTLVQSQTNQNVKLVIPSEINYKCYCNEKYYGTACEFGVCPGTIPCSGGGHPDFGFGAERNTTRSVSAYDVPCTKICVEGKTACPDCVDSCKAKESVCPSERPWRCPSMDCVAAPTRNQCDQGWTYGVLDDPNSARKKNYCVPFDRLIGPSLAQLEAEEARIAFCAGSEGRMIKNEGFLPAGRVEFKSPLIWWSMSVEGNGTLSFTYEDGTPTRGNAGTRIHGTFNYTRSQIEFDAFKVLRTVEVTAAETDGTWNIFPAPFDFNDEDEVPDGFEFVRLVRDGDYYVMMDLVGSFTELNHHGGWGDETGESVLANVSSTQVLRPYGSVVDLDVCLRNLETCVWNTTTLNSRDGARRLCFFENRLTSSRDFNCTAPISNLMRVRTVALGKPRNGRSDDLKHDEWELQSFQPSKTYVLEYETTDYVLVNDVEFLTVDDLRLPCTCQPFGVNVSAYDRKWIKESSRPPPETVGEIAVGYTDVFGDAVMVRGLVVSVDPVIKILPQDESAVEVWGAKRIRPLEAEKGVPDCVSAVHPLRCPDGRCASLREVVIPDVWVDCDCTLLNEHRDAECVCVDELETTHECVCSAGKCDCLNLADRDLENQISRHVREVDGLCFLVQASPEPKESTIKKKSTNESSSVVFSVETFTFPLEFRISPCSEDVTIQAKSFVWRTMDAQIVCSENGTGTIRPVIGYSRSIPYDAWMINGTDEVEAIWAPAGMSLYASSSINYSLSASSNEEDAQNVLWNDDTYWRSSDRDDMHSFFRVDFSENVRLIGVYIVFDTVGLPAGNGMTLNVSVSIQTSQEERADDLNRVHWSTVATLFDDVFHGNSTRYVSMEVPITIKSLRIFSYFPLGLREFVPLTDQDCSQIGTLLVNPNTIFAEDRIVHTIWNSGRNDSEETCFYENSCVLEGGVSAGNDGVCNDFKYVTWDMEPITNVTYRNNNPEELLSRYSMLTTETGVYSFVRGWHVWRSSDVVEPSISITDQWTISSGISRFNETYIYFSASQEGSTYTVNRTSGDLVEYERTSWWPGVEIGSNVCPDGYDGADCGCSNRLSKKAPGLKCYADDFEKRVLEANLSEFQLNASMTVDELLRSNVQIQLNRVRLSRTAVILSRGTCGDCDGRWRCGDGTCVNRPSECEKPTLYDCPGDGCVRANVNRREYKCACKKGRSGLDCGASEALPGDPKTGKVDPHRWIKCAGPPPLKILPPFSLVARKRPYTRRDILTLNRKTPRVKYTDGRVDVGWVHVRPERAPYGVPFLTTYKEGGNTVYTNCPPMVRTPLGDYVTLEECVKKRSPEHPYPVEEWVEFPTLVEGVTKRINWTDELTYDEAPFSCPNSGLCVPTEKDCYQAEMVNPTCGGAGTCLSDATCKCEKGKETFYITPENTAELSVPYYNVGGRTNPIRWGISNPVKPSKQCNARNCTEVDCSAPYGCFAGTPALDFADRQVACEAKSGHAGMCGVDHAACGRGEVVAPLLCSGNGILRKVDYRDEWVCKCGRPISRIATNPRETTELEPNGYGGERCDQYYCGESQNILYYSRVNERTGSFYRDRNDDPLPGVWKGPCGGPAGPSVDDAVAWAQCCPGIKRLEHCTNVLCVIGGTTQCVSIDECAGLERKPKIYPCNGHGKIRGDGSCECDADRNSGTGYTHDYSVFSYDGCWKRVQCQKAVSTGQICNGKKACSEDFKYWTEFPKFPYVEQQVLVLALRQFMAPTNRSVVRTVVRSVQEMDRTVESTYTALALDVQKEIAVVSSDICVFPNDDPSNPFGMPSYAGRESEVGPYMKGFQAPYELRNASYSAVSGSVYPSTSTEVQTILSDGRWPGRLDYERKRNEDYVTLRRVSGVIAGSQIIITFDELKSVAAIRVNARSVGELGGRLSFKGDSGADVCNPMYIGVSNDFLWWGGDDFGVHCLQEYSEYRFDLENPSDDTLNCGSDPFSEQCFQWKDSVCLSKGGKIRLPGSVETYLRCPISARCCIPVGGTYAPTEKLMLQVQLETHETVLEIAEVTVFGYGSTVETDVPSGMLAEMNGRTGQSTCRDQIFMRSSDGFAQENLEFFRYRNWINQEDDDDVPLPYVGANFDSAENLCESVGGVLAASRGGSDSIESMGLACFGRNEFELSLHPAGQSDEVPNGACWIGARNRRFDSVDPPPTSVLIEPSCSSWGCFSKIEGVSYFATPKYDDGLQWKNEQWRSTSPSWTAWLRDAARKAYQQIQSAVVDKTRTMVQTQTDGRLGMKFEYYERQSYDPLTSCGNVDEWALCRKEVDFLDRYELKTVDKTNVIPDGAPSGGQKTTEYWTNAQMCVLTIWSGPACGTSDASFKFDDRNGQAHGEDRWGLRHKYGSVYLPNSVVQDGRLRFWYDEITGFAFKQFIFGPGDDYEKFGDVTLDGSTFDQCQLSGSATCKNFGKKINDPDVVHSFSIQGPCKLKARSRSTHSCLKGIDSQGWFNVDGEDHYRVGTIIHSLYGKRHIRRTGSGPDPYSYMGPDLSDTALWPKGCRANVVTEEQGADMTRLIDPFPEVNSGRFDRSCTDSEEKGVHDKGHYQYYVTPKFNSTKVRVTMLVPDNGHSDKFSSEHYMGWKTHPYMCAAVRVEKIMSVDTTKYPTTNSNTTRVEVEVHDPPVLIKEYESVVPDGDFSANTYPKFFNCNTPDSPRYVRPCTECPIKQPVGDWQWNQRFYDPSTSTFATEITDTTKMTTEMHVGYSKTIDQRWRIEYVTFSGGQVSEIIEVFNRVATPLVPVSQLLGTLKYGRILSTLDFSTDYERTVLPTYHRGYQGSTKGLTNLYSHVSAQASVFLPRCARVAHRDGQYVLESALCETKQRVLCARDYLRYTVQSGRQCDVCGPLSRSTALSPGATVFSLHPKANSTLYPFEHSVLDAYLSGELSLMLETTDIDWDSAVAYLSDLNVSMAFAFESFRKAFYTGFSDRPGRVSRGQVANPTSWIDADFARWFPEDCGRQTSKATGITRRRCAVSKQYCDPDAPQFSGTTMSSADVPSVLLPVASTTDGKYELSCGTTINPAYFAVRDADGGPAPTKISSKYRLVETGADYVVLKALVDSAQGEWRNTGKRQHLRYQVNTTYWITGKVECSAACEVGVLLSTMSVTYGVPSTTVYLGSSIDGATYEFEFRKETEVDPEGYPLQILGWNLSTATKGTTVRIKSALVTTLDSISKCKKERRFIPYVEIPSSVDSAAPEHVCPYTPSEARDLGDDAQVGQCFCSPSSPYSGPACEWHAVTSFRGKHVCNFYGDYDSMAVAPDGSGLVPVIQDGVFEYGGGGGGQFYCKCRNVGVTIQSFFDTQSASHEHRFVTLHEKLPNEDTFVVVSGSVKGDEVNEACASESSTLPSFVTADELTQFLTAAGDDSVFMDLQLSESDGERVFRWYQRNVPLTRCDVENVNETSCLGEILTEPCTDTELCSALNWNNLAYGTTGDFITDGKNVSGDASLPFTVTLTSASSLSLDVELWSDLDNDFSSSGHLTVSTNEGTPCVRTYFGPDTLQGPEVKWTCAVTTSITYVTFTRGGLGSVKIREVTMFEDGDPGRVTGLFN